MSTSQVSEHALQKTIVQCLRVNGCYVICTDVSCGSGYLSGTRKQRFLNHIRALGFTKGQPDLVVLHPDKGVFLVELKTTVGRLSQEQKDIQEWCKEHKIKHMVWRTLEDCLNWVG